MKESDILNLEEKKIGVDGQQGKRPQGEYRGLGGAGGGHVCSAVFTDNDKE